MKLEKQIFYGFEKTENFDYKQWSGAYYSLAGKRSTNVKHFLLQELREVMWSPSL